MKLQMVYSQHLPCFFMQSVLSWRISVQYAYGKVYTYEVRENKLITTSNSSTAFKHEDNARITLITCENFNASKTSYDYRRMVRAVLVSVK
jgi:sortase (surface protein transpeptidase)